MADIIQVLPDETIDGLVAKVTALAGSNPGEPVRLWVPRGIAILHQMEDFQALKGLMRRQGVQIKILSPDARVVGLGKVFGVEAETTTHLPGAPAPDAARPANPPPAPPSAPSTLSVAPPAAAARRPSTTPLPPAAPPPAVPPAPSRRPTTTPLGPSISAAPPEPEATPGVSETDWLLGDGGNLDALLDDDEHSGRSATPPPDVLLPGLALPPAPPAAASAAPVTGTATSETDWLTQGLDLESRAAEPLNPDVLPAPPTADSALPSPAALAPTDPFAGAPVPPPDLPAPPPIAPVDPFAASFDQVTPFYIESTPPAAAPPAPAMESFSLSDLLQAGEDEGGGPPMSFADWLALQGSGTAATAGAPAPPPDVNLDNLPAWMRPEPPAAAPPAAPAPAGRKGVLRCPHCGEELDKEEMLRMLAEVWGLDS